MYMCMVQIVVQSSPPSSSGKMFPSRKLVARRQSSQFSFSCNFLPDSGNYQPPFCLSIYVFSMFQISGVTQINGVTQYLSFCVWLHSANVQTLIWEVWDGAWGPAFLLYHLMLLLLAKGWCLDASVSCSPLRSRAGQSIDWPTLAG